MVCNKGELFESFDEFEVKIKAFSNWEQRSVFQENRRIKNKLLPNHWCVLYGGRNSLPPMLEVLESNISAIQKKSIELKNCRWCKLESIDPAFSFTSKGKQYTLIAQSEQERQQWVNYLSCITPGLSANRNKSDMPSVKSSKIKKADDETVMQANVLYSSYNQGDSFDVVADHNKGDCSKFNLKGMYNLTFDANNISLLIHGTDKLRAAWGYYCLRSYGHSNHAVRFDVGTHSSTGEGQFSFLTADGAQIVDIITKQTMRLKQQTKQDNPNHSQSDASQAFNVKTSSSMSKPPVFPKNKLSYTSSNASTKSGDATASNSGCPNPDKTKRKPAPLAPFPSASGGVVLSKQNSNGLDENFRQELNLSLGVPSSPTLSASDGHKKSFSSAMSLDSISSTSNSSKTDKKKLKEQEKERKKKEKKEAEERERERKAAKQREKEEKKAMKKLQQENKKGKSSSSTISSSQEYSQVDDHTYAEANDHYIVSNRSTIAQGESESGYTYIEGVDINRKKSQESSEEMYATPWKNLLSTDGACPSPNPMLSGDGEETVYASPKKKSNTGQQQHPNICESYEEFEVQNPVPPAIPSRASIDGDPSNSVYDHFHNPGEISDPTDNVYGMESASAPLASNVASPNTVDTDVYETI